MKKIIILLMVLSHVCLFGNNEKDIINVNQPNSHVTLKDESNRIVQKSERKVSLMEMKYIKEHTKMLKEKAKNVESSIFQYERGKPSGTICVSKRYLSNENSKVEDTVIGELITDAMRELSGCDIAMFNSGEIKDEIKKGDVTFSDVKRIITEENKLVLFELSGYKVVKLIASVTDNESTEDYLNVSGISWESRFGNIENMLVNGEELKLDKRYIVAVNSYIADGNGMFALFKEEKIFYRTERNISSILAMKLNKMKSIENSYPLEIRNKKLW